MRRTVTIAAMLLLAFSVLGSTATAATTGTAAATRTATAAACAGTIDITQLAYSPASVSPGQFSTMNLTAVDCTAQPVTATLISYGQFHGSGSTTGIPPGCAAIDPLAQPVTLAPNGTYSTSLGILVPASCTATTLEGIVRFDSSGGTLASGTALLTIVQPVPPVACHVAYTVQSQWAGGFVASIAITNTGTVSDNGWTLAFTFGGDQKIVTPWGATAVQSGPSVSLSNQSYDAAIAPGSTITIGFQGSWNSSNAAPSQFTLNGTACS